MDSVFFTKFLMISNFTTIGLIAVLFVAFYLMKQLEKKKVSFASRMLIGTGGGVLLGFIIQAVSGFSDNPMSIQFVAETTKWYSLFGNGFVDMIKMLVVPLVMVSIVHVIINMDDNANLGKLTSRTIITTMLMVMISVVIGLCVGMFFDLGSGMAIEGGTAKMKEVKNIVDTLRGLLPANPAQAMLSTNIIALVIMAAIFATCAKRMAKKYMDVVKPFFDIINALHKIIMSVAMLIIKYMPYAVIALLANTIAQRGMGSILEVGLFIIALYIAAVITFVVQMVALLVFGINPMAYVKKSIPVMVMAFTSRSSVGTLPLTIETLTRRLGVNDGTASFVAGFGTTAGMQGCAGFFPALLLVFVANMNGMPIDVTFIIMTLIVVSLGSLGIAGIPGTATMAASVSLSGMGLAAYFPAISPILAIDPIIDMARTLLNVTGALTNALMVDKQLGQLNMDEYNDMSR